MSRLTAVAIALLLALTLVGTAPPPAAEAAIQAPFNQVYSAEDNGAISIVGNAQMTCQDAVAGCIAARSGGGTNVNNNNYAMQFSDVDGVPATTNSTTAEVALPVGSTVLYARLLWSARIDAGAGGVAAVSANAGVAKFRSPTESGYSTVTATKLVKPEISSHPYQASLEVTDTLRAGGNGTYAFADMTGGTGSDVYAGWSLVIAYQNPSLPLRNLTVFEGFADISTSTGNNSVTATVTGFLTPATGSVNATVGVGAWEGDLGSTGDSLKFNGATLSDPTRPATNFFDSSISNLGVRNTARNPGPSNNLGVDMGRISADGVLANGANSATVNVSTTGETIYLGLITTEIDLYTPSFAGISKTVTNLSGNSPAQVGDTLEYRLTFTNSGQDIAAAVRVRDVLPANVTFVPGSILVVTGAGASTTPKTDTSGDDVAEYVAESRQLAVRLGVGANQTAGGTVAPGAGSDVTFRVTLDVASAGTTVSNGGFLDYRAQTLGRDYTFTTNVVSTPVTALADLAITQTSSPTTQTAGSQVSYPLVLTNLGPSTATSVVTTDTLPAGVSYAGVALPAGTTCSVSGQTVTCTTASLASGVSITIGITGDVAAGAPAGTLLNTATVTSATSDPTTSNNTATSATTITTSADLLVTKTGSASVAAGSPATYTLTVTNAGPSSATDAVVTDALPLGVTLVSTDPSQGSCTAAGQTVTCSLGTLAPAGSATVGVVATVGASVTTASLLNSASTTSSTPDPTLGNNTATAETAVTQNADLVVTTTASPSTATAGNLVTYTVDVANLAGRSDAGGVELSDTLPAGFTATEVTATQGSCTATSPISCDLGLITPGSTVRVVISARVDSDQDPGTVSNTARATTSTNQSVTSNDSDSATVDVTTQADLSLTKAASPNPVQLGTDLVYTLTAANNGPSQARGVVITDPLPAGVTFVSASSGCSELARTVTCSIGALDVGDATSRTITVTTPQTVPDSPLTNTATVGATTNDPSTDDNTATFESSTQASADLAMVKTTSPNPVVPGRDVTYTLTASNHGPSAAQGVRVTDTLPTGVTFRSAGVAGGGGSCTRTGQDISCSLGSLGGGSNRVVTVVGAVDPDLTGSSTANTAAVDSASTEDPTSSNNADTSVAEIDRSADVGVVMTTTTPTVRAGEAATFRIVATNAGPSTARGTIVTAQVPEGLEVVPESLDGRCEITGRTVSCELATLAVDGTEALTFAATVSPSTPGGSLIGQAFVGATTGDPDATDNASTVDLTVVTAADLAAGTTVSPDPVVAGRPATYVLTAANLGPSDTTDVILTDTLPAGVTVTSVDPSAGSCVVDGREITCTAGRLSAGEVLTVRVVVDVDPAAAAGLTNTVTVASGTTDPATSNNTMTVTSDVGPVSDLRLSKTAGPDPVIAGSAVRYSLTTVNLGPSQAAAVNLDDLLPTGLQILTGGVDAPPGVTCSQDASAARVSCDLGDLAPGASRTITVDALVPSTAASGSTFTNSATLTSPTPALESADRSDSVTSTVTTSADLSLTKTALSETATAGQPVRWQLAVHNAGNSVARSVAVEDPAPAGLTFTAAETPQGSCPVTTRAVSCALGDVEAGATVTVTVTGDLDGGFEGSELTNRATLSSATPDPGDDDNGGSVTSPVLVSADLAVTKTASSETVTAGDTVTWSIRVADLGPSDARDVELTDVLPAGVTLVSRALDGAGECSGDTTLTCDLGTLGSGSDRVLTVVARVGAAYRGSTISNTAAVSTSTPDATASNDTSTSVANVSRVAGLSVTKTGPPTATAGQSVSWQLEVHNDGPSQARDVVVLDAVPAGVEQLGSPVQDGVTCTVTGSDVRCTVAVLDPGTDRTVIVTGLVGAGYTGAELVNTARVSSDAADPDPTDNTSAPAITTVERKADVSITKSVAPNPIVAGGPASFTLEVSNAGPSSAREVVAVDEVPAGMVIGDVTTTTGSCTPDGQLVRCDLGEVPPTGDTPVIITISVAVDGDFSPGGFVNTASVSTADPDPDTGNNVAQVEGGTAAQADLTMTKEADSETAVAGGLISWTLTVDNAGPATARRVRVLDILPSDLTDVVVTTPDGTCRPGPILSCDLGDVQSGEGAVIGVTGRIAAGTRATSIVNSAVVSAAGTADPKEDNNLRQAVTPLVGAADLSLTKTTDTTDIVAGAPVQWTVTAGNAGPSVAYDVEVTDLLPAAPTGPLPAGCTAQDRALRCAVGTLAVGQTQAFLITATVDPGQVGPLSNTARISSAVVDSNPDDNTATTPPAPVRRVADLSVSKTADGGRLRVGDRVTYRVGVGSEGPSDATAVEVHEEWPDGVDFVSADPTAGTFDAATMRWSVGVLRPGQSEELVLVGTVASEGGLRNSVSVSAAGVTDPNPDDDTAAVTLALAGPGSGSGQGGQLPNTGGPGMGLLMLGVLGVGAGAGLLGGGRRRPRRQRR